MKTQKQVLTYILLGGKSFRMYMLFHMKNTQNLIGAILDIPNNRNVEIVAFNVLINDIISESLVKKAVKANNDDFLIKTLGWNRHLPSRTLALLFEKLEPKLNAGMIKCHFKSQVDITKLPQYMKDKLDLC